MTTPPFTKTVYGKMQKREYGLNSKRVRIWLNRLNRAQTIIDCSWARFNWRWRPNLSSTELEDALNHRYDPDLWLDAMLIIAERKKYYTQFVQNDWPGVMRQLRKYESHRHINM